MPLYRYLCPDCGAVAELLRPIAQRDLPVTCSGFTGPLGHRNLSLVHGTMRRIIDSPAVHFSGTGVTRGSSAFGRAAPAESQDGGGGPAERSKTP